MATILTKLPRELRDQIYRELLVDDVHCTGLNNDCLARKQLFPAILQVCKQVFIEASKILYEENSFLFTDAFYWDHYSEEHDHLYDVKGALSRAGPILFPTPGKPCAGFSRIKHVSKTPLPGSSLFNE